MDLRKWERVWEKAGDRPTAFTEWTHSDGDEDTDHLQVYIGSELLSRGPIEAIIRDWAEGWIMEHHANAIVNDGFDWIVAYLYSDGDRDVFGMSTDRTEALYFACCKVLGIEP